MGNFVDDSAIPVIQDNMVFSLQRAGGGSVYWSHLQQSCVDDSKIKLSIIERPDALDNASRKYMNLDGVSVLPQPNYHLRIDEIRKIAVRESVPTLFHSSFFRFGVGDNCINITTVHDFICKRQYSGFVKHFSFWQIRRAVAHSDALIVISESTKKDLLAFIPEASRLPIEVIPQGYGSEFSYKGRASREKRAVFIGARGVAYKNFKAAVEAVSLTDGITLCVIGSPLTDAESSMLDSMLPGRYESYVYPTSEEICDIFNSSTALLYLSEYEGFGIPPLEAMASGLPVIAINTSSIPEVVGDAGILLETCDSVQVARELNGLLASQSYFNDVVLRGIEQASKFSWERTAELTKQYYRYIWEGHR